MFGSKEASLMANIEKKKKGLNKFIHKGGNGNQPKVELDSSVLPNKKSISLAWLSKKAKAIPEIEKEKGEQKRVEVEGPVIVEARKSVSHVETNVASVASFLQVKVLVSDMPSFMQVQAFRCARRTYDSLEKFSTKHMAFNIKKEFDKVHGPTWHCIVGSSFGSFVTHSTGCFLYFSMEKLYILLFKTKVQKKVRD